MIVVVVMFGLLILLKSFNDNLRICLWVWWGGFVFMLFGFVCVGLVGVVIDVV